MKKYRIITGIVLALLFISPQAAVTIDDQGPNVLVKHDSNEQEVMSKLDWSENRGHHPTRIVRLDGEITESGVSCQDVQQAVADTFFSHINGSHFLYNTLMMCHYDPQTHDAAHLSIDSYIDPISNDDEAMLHQLEQTFEGYLFFGVPLHIEKAQGVIISLELNAAREDKHGDPRIIRFRRDHKTLYFNSNFDLTKQFIIDVRRRFYSQNPDVILPFIRQWFYESLGDAYASLLRKVNLVELLPERIFVMQSGEPTFTSHLHMYYLNHCQRYDSKVCLDA